MGKEIIVGVNGGHVRRFCEAIDSTPEIDFRNFSPHLSLRCAITDNLVKDSSVKISAAVDGGPLDLLINGCPVEDFRVTDESLRSVVEVFCPGRGREITASMLAKGAVLVLNRS